MYSFLSKANYKCWNTDFVEAEKELAKTKEWNPYSSLMFAMVRMLEGAITGDDDIRVEGAKRLHHTGKVIKLYKGHPERIEELASKIKKENQSCEPYQPHDPKKADEIMNEIIPEDWKDVVKNVGGQRCFLPLSNDRVYNVTTQIDLDIQCIEAHRLLYLSGNEFQSGSFLKGAYHMKNCYQLFKKLYTLVKQLQEKEEETKGKSSEIDSFVPSAPITIDLDSFDVNDQSIDEKLGKRLSSTLPKIHPEIKDRILFGFSFFSFFIKLLPPFFQKLLSFVMGNEVFEVDGIEEFKKQKSSTIVGLSFFVLGVHTIFIPSGVADFRESKMKDFVPILHNFLSHYPESILVDLVIAQFSRKLGKFKPVIRRLEEAKKRYFSSSSSSHPILLNLSNDLGSAYFNLGNWDMVILTFEDIVKTSEEKKFQFRALVALQCCIAYCGIDKKQEFYALWRRLLDFTKGGNKYTQYVAPYIIRTKKLLDGFVKKNHNWEKVKKLFLGLLYYEILYLKRDLDTYSQEDLKRLGLRFMKGLDSVTKIYSEVDKRCTSGALISNKFEKLLGPSLKKNDDSAKGEGKGKGKGRPSLKEKLEELVNLESRKTSGDWVIPFAMYELGELHYKNKEYETANKYFERCKGKSKYAFSEVLRARAVISIKQIESLMKKESDIQKLKVEEVEGVE